jgi:molybdate transport repressor ModE-like protein
MRGDQRDPWLGIELRHLAALQAIEAEGTFSDAALSLGYVQSAVSGQLAMLERLMGTQLVERSTGPGTQRLTAAGEVLVTHSQEILEVLQAARKGIRDAGKHEQPAFRLCIGTAVPDGIAGRVLSKVMGRGYASLIAETRTLPPAAIEGALLDGEADVAICDPAIEHPDVATAEICRLQPELLVEARSPLARRPVAPTLEELCHLPLIAWREGGDPSRIELELADAGLEPNVLLRAANTDTIAPMVASGIGVAVLPQDSHRDSAAVVGLSLADALPSRVVGVAWHRTRAAEPMIRRFVEIACRLREEH